MFGTKYLVWLYFAVGYLVLHFVPAHQGACSPILQEEEEIVKKTEPKKNTRSIKLVYKRNEFREMEERGFIPAWIDSDGLMRVPLFETEAEIQLDNTQSSSEAMKELADHHYSVVVPFPPSDENTKTNDDNLSRFKEFVPILRRQTTGKTSGQRMSERIKVPLDECTECNTNFLTPTLTYSDGSDIFKHDLYNPHDSYPTEFNESNVKLPYSCYLVEGAQGHLICTDRILTKVPDNLPKEPLSILEINNTNIKTLESWDFNQLDVVAMKIYGNSIRTIEPNAFNGINSLLTLSLRHNSIQSLDWMQFNGLSELVILSLRGNQINLTEGFLEMPTNSLTVLPELAYLDLAENSLVELNEFVFWALRDSPITELNLKSCKLEYIHPAAFEPLTSLLHVDFFNNSGLVPIFMNEIKVPSLPPNVHSVGLGSNTFSFSVPLQLLRNISDNLFEINLSGNFFFRVTDSLLPASLFPNLKILIMENCLITFISEGAFRNHSKLGYLYLASNQLTQILPETLPPALQVLSIRQNPLGSGTFSLCKETMDGLPNLVWLDMSFMKLDSSNLSADVFHGLRKLNILQMRSSGLVEIPATFFSSLSQLLVLDLGHNLLRSLPQDFSTGLHNTMMVFLDNCWLDFADDEPSDYQPFRSMSNLQCLYLNRNQINEFPPNLVVNLTNLYVLLLAENNIVTWQQGTTAYMSPDAAIDVSNNRIVFLPNQTYGEFSRIAAIDLSDNALTCNCQTQDLQRLANSNMTKVLNWEKERAYICFETSSNEDGEDVIKEIPLMSEEEFHCEDREVNSTTQSPDTGDGDDDDTKTIVSSVVGAILIVGLLVGIVASCYCKRSYGQRKFFYFRQNVTSSLDLRSDNQDDDDSHNEYEYDAFISFNEQDRPWVYTQLVPKLEPRKDPSDCTQETDSVPSFHLCLHDRDFTVGQQITENIIENIAKSRKVVIVLSRSYVESKWCQFELHLSQHRLLESERRDALVLILLEDVPKEQQNAGLRYLLTTRTYLAWRNDIEGQQLFWHRLRQVLTVRHQKSSLTSSKQTIISSAESST